ncbi:MAG: sporulation protein YqfD [Christensenellaceae bacterium]|jgi:hypothetical protein|nr:sporulation protein YqfD [Christensenellaceae bacterium]
MASKKRKNSRIEYLIKTNLLFSLNKLSKIANLYNVRKLDNHSMKFGVDLKYNSTINSFLDSMDIEYVCINKNTKKKYFVCLLFIILSLIICIYISYLYSICVTDIKIIGASSDQQLLINNIISDAGINQYGINFFVDYAMIPDKIYELDNISNVDIYKSKTTLVIDIRTSLEKIDLTPKPIIAKFDGTITSITVSSGTALVKVGQSVLKGDVLIAPYRINNEGFEAVHASGIITGQLVIQKHLVFTNKQVKYELSGKQYSKSFLTLKESVINYTEIPFEYYKMSKYTTNAFPFYITTYEYSELIKTEEEFDFLMDKDEILSRELTKLIATSNFAESINATFDYEITNSGCFTILSIYYYASGDLS